MTDYATQDAPIDRLLWQAIADSPCPEDFRDYLQHAPEGAAHSDEAIERLIVLDDADAVCGTDEARYPAAVTAIETLASAGNPVAQFHMGKLCDNGIGMAIDRERSEGWYRLAILQGETRSQVNLALRLDQQDSPAACDEAWRLLQAVAEAGVGTATYNLAHRLARRAANGETAEWARAFELFHQAWEQGNSTAGHFIGYLLLRGNGVRRDEVLGHEWMDRAARAGCVAAIVHLGSRAENGNGGEKDIPAAIAWFRQGAELGDAECQHRLGHLLLRGEGIPKDGAQAVNWLKRAAVRGHQDAQRILGLTYLWGIDVIRNARFGRKWLTRAAEQGDAHSAYHLGKVCQKTKKLSVNNI